MTAEAGVPGAHASTERPLLSVVIPVYNGADSIARLVAEVRGRLSDIAPEIVLVVDGSPDDSDKECTALADADAGVKCIVLRRNFGEHNAVMCGLNHCTGEWAAIIDDDFQNPPSEIVKLLEEGRRAGHDVVYSYYARKRHHWFRNAGSRFNDTVATWLLGKPADLYLSSFKLIHRGVIDEIVKYRGPFPYVDGLIFRVTRRRVGRVLVEHMARGEGRSSYTLGKLVSLWMNMFLNFSIKPLRVFTVAGFVIFALAVLLSAVFVAEKLLHPEMPAGWTSLMVALMGLSGIQLMMLGLIGEYLGKAYLDLSGTPQWVVRSSVLHGGPARGTAARSGDGGESGPTPAG